MTRSRHSHPRNGVLLAAAFALALLSACASPRHARVVVFHTNDVHGHIERRGDSLGAAEVAGAIRRERAAHGDVLVLDAGDMISGTPLSSLTRGRGPVSVMARMGFDAAALGNHELDHGWRQVASFRTIAAFPFLCANAFAPDGELLADAPWDVFERAGLSVAVLGLITEDALEQTVRTGNEGVMVRPPAETLQEWMPELRHRADIVVLLSHCGLDVDREMARTIPGIDLIVGGHSHDALESPERVGDTWIAHAGSYLRVLGRLEIVYDRREGRVTEVTGELLRPTGPIDPDVAAAVQGFERSLGADLDRRIGENPEPADRARIQAATAAVFRDRTGADLGYHNPGGVRATLPAGPITVRGIWEALPFENTIVVIRMRGSDLPAELRRRLGDGWREDGEYRVATNSYVAQQQKRYLGRGGYPVEDSGIPMRDAVIEAVEAQGSLPGETR